MLRLIPNEYVTNRQPLGSGKYGSVHLVPATTWQKLTMQGKSMNVPPANTLNANGPPQFVAVKEQVVGRRYGSPRWGNKKQTVDEVEANAHYQLARCPEARQFVPKFYGSVVLKNPKTGKNFRLIAMEWLEGYTPLASFCRWPMRSSKRDLLEAAIVKALVGMKKCGFDHNDFHASNVMVKPWGEDIKGYHVKLIDFGYAKRWSESPVERAGGQNFIQPYNINYRRFKETMNRCPWMDSIGSSNRNLNQSSNSKSKRGSKSTTTTSNSNLLLPVRNSPRLMSPARLQTKRSRSPTPRNMGKKQKVNHWSPFPPSFF